jgi:cell division protein FtsB
MWPKALLELLPHLTRLVPLVNRYFDSKGADEDATRVALERKLGETAAALRVDIQRGAEAGEALQAQISRQTATLNEVAAGVKALKASDEAIEARIAKLEERAGRQGLLYAVVLLQVVAIAILIVLLVLSRHR